MTIPEISAAIASARTMADILKGILEQMAVCHRMCAPHLLCPLEEETFVFPKKSYSDLEDILMIARMEREGDDNRWSAKIIGGLRGRFL